MKSARSKREKVNDRHSLLITGVVWVRAGPSARLFPGRGGRRVTGLTGLFEEREVPPSL